MDLQSNEAAILEVAVPDNQTDQLAGTFRSKLGDDMRKRFLRVIPVGILCCLALPAVMQAQSDPARIFKTAGVAETERDKTTAIYPKSAMLFRFQRRPAVTHVYR